jgi:hypothetical protein
LFLAFCVIQAHRKVLRIDDPLRRNAASAMLALSQSFIVLSLLSGNVLVIFPINVFACLFCGMVLVIFQHDKLAALEPEEETVPLMAPVDAPEPAVPVRIVHRFTRTGQPTC